MPTISPIASKRLRREASHLQTDPPPGIIAEPEESDLLTWHYALRGPSETPYEAGTYVGRLVFPPDYPLKAPSIYMRTPSGRFEIETKLCLSMSDFHPESWNPLWSVSSILQGIQSFMASTELTTGGLRTTAAEQINLAAASGEYNAKHFPDLFGGDIEAAFAAAEAARAKAAAAAATANKNSNDVTTPSSLASIRRRTRGTRAGAIQKKKEKPSSNGDAGSSVLVLLTPTTKELSAEEAEKRRIKNAKKRAKQKAKKAATAPDAQYGIGEQIETGGEQVA